MNAVCARARVRVMRRISGSWASCSVNREKDGWT